jgi:hypothetical protein
MDRNTTYGENSFMNIRFAVPFFLLFLAGCAAFKELEPIPPVQSAERGFIELRNDKENFLLKKNKQYFIKFPKAADTHFYITLETGAKKKLHNYFTAKFNDGEPPIIPITDEMPDQDSLSLFAIDTSTAFFCWVMDTVYQDMPLTIKYRYVPQWRYTVETKYDEYRQVLSDNKFDRSNYEAMGPQFDFSALNAKSEQERLQQKNKSLSQMNEALVKLERVFPANIASSNDTMYQRYVSLSNDTKDELRFQSDYDAVLSILQREAETKDNLSAFVERAPEFTKFLEQKERFRAPILDYMRSVYIRRLGEALAVYDAQLQKRNDLTPIELKPPFGDVEKFYIACGQQLPAEVKEVREYVSDFNQQVLGLKNAGQKYEAARLATQRKVTWPDDMYYPTLLGKIDEARSAVPEYALGKYEHYKEFATTTLLDQEIKSAVKRVSDLQGPYKRAGDIVQRINSLKGQKDYKGIVQVLRENKDLGFVLSHYPDIDELVLKSQTDKIRELIDSDDWKNAEQGLSDLMNNKDYLNLTVVAPKKAEAVRSFETQLFERVKKLTFERADVFAKKNELTLENVPALYADSALLPVYLITYSSESPGRVVQKRKAIDDYLRQLKQIRFPENSIRLIYKELIRAMHDKGVEKARAILAHSKFYKGQDKSVRNIIDECDPMIAKTVAKPKDYRRIMVLPVNDMASESNEYVFRMNVKIPSEAKFPVYDVNIKVPQEVADNAGKKQWFTEMTLNKKVIKTEGHMRVTAPTSDNEYEAQITPVQMLKDRDNIIEVRFKYPEFKLFEVSVMAQVPIIRKN